MFATTTNSNATTNATTKRFYSTRKENGLAVTRFSSDTRKWHSFKEGNVTVTQFI